MNNLVTRSLSGIVFIAVVLVCLLTDKYLYGVLGLFLTAGMLLEFYKLSTSGRHPHAKWLAVAAGAAWFALVFCHQVWGLDARFLSLPVILLALIVVTAVFGGDIANMEDYAYMFTGLLYIAGPLALSNFLVFRGGEFSGLLMLCFFIMIWCSDVGAYCIGTAFGQKPDSRKLAPAISPKKSWVGFWGGMVFCIAAALLLKYAGLMDLAPVHCVVLGMTVHTGGVCGDLFESLWKRHFGVKDSGNLIPGHGGLLDRFDSALVAIPLGALYLSLTSLL